MNIDRRSDFINEAPLLKRHAKVQFLTVRVDLKPLKTPRWRYNGAHNACLLPTKTNGYTPFISPSPLWVESGP